VGNVPLGVTLPEDSVLSYACVRVASGRTWRALVVSGIVVLAAGCSATDVSEGSSTAPVTQLTTTTTAATTSTTAATIFSASQRAEMAERIREFYPETSVTIDEYPGGRFVVKTSYSSSTTGLAPNGVCTYAVGELGAGAGSTRSVEVQSVNGVALARSTGERGFACKPVR
jgi:hypothetical protein